MEILVPGQFTYSGAVNSGTTVFGSVPFTVQSYSCGQIVNDLNDYQSASGYFPVDCDFVTLSSTGVVFFMDPNTQQLGNSLLISASVSVTSQAFTEEDMDYVYTTEGGFIISMLVWLTFMRQIRKFKQRRNGAKLNPI